MVRRAERDVRQEDWRERSFCSITGELLRGPWGKGGAEGWK